MSPHSRDPRHAKIHVFQPNRACTQPHLADFNLQTTALRDSYGARSH
jgi:hypothetical protein